jgi:hypothetical protein
MSASAAILAINSCLFIGLLIHKGLRSHYLN